VRFDDYLSFKENQKWCCFLLLFSRERASWWGRISLLPPSFACGVHICPICRMLLHPPFRSAPFIFISFFAFFFILSLAFTYLFLSFFYILNISRNMQHYIIFFILLYLFFYFTLVLFHAFFPFYLLVLFSLSFKKIISYIFILLTLFTCCFYFLELSSHLLFSFIIHLFALVLV